MNDSQSKRWCEKLYEAKSATLLLYGRALGLSHSEAEDVLQDTFAALLGMGSEPENPEHYGLRAFRNRALNYRRSVWRRIRREFESQRWFEKSREEGHRERRAMDCLKTLPIEQREVIVLKIWHEHTFDAIARVLDLSPNTVAGRYRYGLLKLKACMKGDTYAEFTGEETAIVGPASSFT